MIGDPASASGPLALRQACSELGRRLRSGLSCSAEDFLAADSSLTADADAAVELIYTEFVIREELGEQLQPDSWVARFPLWRGELERVFEIHRLAAEQPTRRSGVSGTHKDPRFDPADSNRHCAALDEAKFAAGYELLGEIGRGGMGVVYQARQHGLGRVVALKTIFAPHEPRERARFRAEAHATARLSHPNIVQIYEVGQDEEHPFLSMEFVAGRSLDKQLLDSPLTARAAAELLLTLARAVAYAHQQGIVHRDLKPANILITSDGNPKITDFGLARLLVPPGDESCHYDLTQTGAIVGTPSYMAPEQCRGAGGQVGPAADVYALGAILYEALTGRPPFRGETALDTLELVRWQEAVPPRRLVPKIPRELETICLKCLQKQPHQRYASGTALADDFQRFLAGEPIVARRVSLVERTWRLARRRPLVAALVASLAAALVVGIGGIVWQSHRADQHARRADQHARRADQHARQASQSAQLERAARELAEFRFGQAEKAVGDYLDGIENNERLKQADFFDLRKQLLASAIPFYEDFVQQKPGEASLEARRGQAYGRLAIVRRSLGDHERAVADLQEMKGVYERLSAATTDYRHQLAKAHRQLAVLFHEMGRHGEAAEEYAAAMEHYRRLAAEFPDRAAYRLELATCLNNFGVHLIALGNKTAAKTPIGEALELTERLTGEHPELPGAEEEVARAHHNLAAVTTKGEEDVAADHFRLAIMARERLVERHPALPLHRQDLAWAHVSFGTFLDKILKRNEAVEEFRRALPLQNQLVAGFPTVPQYRWTLARTHLHLGTTLHALAKDEEAEQEHRRGLAIFQQLASDHPSVPDYRRDLAQCHGHLGMVLDRLGRDKELEVEYRAALDIEQQLASDFPMVPLYRQHLAARHYNLGYYYARRNRRSEAEIEHRRAIDLRKGLVKELPHDIDILRQLAISQKNLAFVLAALGKQAEAEAVGREQVTSRTQLLERFPNDPEYHAGCAGALDTLAAILRKQRQLDEARRLQAQAVEHQLQACRLNPSDSKLAASVRTYCQHQAEIIAELRDYVSAAEIATRMAELKPSVTENTMAAAQALAYCARLAARDERLDAAERESTVNNYADESMHWLQEAVRRGIRDAQRIKSDRYFAPLRERPDFQELLQALESKEPAA